MAHTPITLVAPVIVILAAASGFCGHALAQPTHKCDPVDPIADVGWSVVPSLETVGVVDGAPYQAGISGDWFVERTTTRIPFCNYYNEIGIYSMRSYTLPPEVIKEQIQICVRGNTHAISIQRAYQSLTPRTCSIEGREPTEQRASGPGDPVGEP